MASKAEFCNDCQLLLFDQSRIVDEEVRGYRGFVPLAYHLQDDFPLLPKLIKAAANGCHVCAFIKQVVQSHFRLDPAIAGYLHSEEKRLKNRPQPEPKKLSVVLSEYLLSGSRWL